MNIKAIVIASSVSVLSHSPTAEALQAPLINKPSAATSERPQLVTTSLLMHGKALVSPDIDYSNYLISEKLDGVRAYWDGANFWSRQGYAISVPSYLTRDLPSIPLDGELWLGRGKFSQISGLISRNNPQDPAWQDVQYAVFDMPVSNEIFQRRFERLRNLIPYDSTYVFLVGQFTVSNHRAAERFFKEIIELNGEGAMLHHKRNFYTPGRTTQLLKMKPNDLTEATVLAYKEGTGKYAGQVGSLRVLDQDGNSFYVGSGLTDQLRANPPKIGAVIEIEHTGHTNHGIPRFPRFVRIMSN